MYQRDAACLQIHSAAALVTPGASLAAAPQPQPRISPNNYIYTSNASTLQVTFPACQEHCRLNTQDHFRGTQMNCILVPGTPVCDVIILGGKREDCCLHCRSCSMFRQDQEGTSTLHVSTYRTSAA